MPIACITGATSGIGRAVAERFLKEGWKLILMGRRADRLQSMAEAAPDRILPIQLDVRDRKAVARAFDELPEDFASIDLLLNSAGLALGLSPAPECDLDDWDTMVDTNIKGLMYCSRAVLPGMVARKSGQIVNIGSIAGTYAYAGGNVYGASKSFVLQFSRNLRCDLHGTGVRVTNIEPGLLETEFSNVRFKGDTGKADSVYAGTKPLVASDIADIVWWVNATPAHVDITQVEVMPTCQSLGSTRVAKEYS